MDRLGRRPLLLVPMVVMVLILALITIALKLQVNCLVSLRCRAHLSRIAILWASVLILHG